jgi:GntR family transcriptional regulator/MocR family aminotransferase
VEEPGYPDARNIFALRTPKVIGLAIDGDGLVANHRLNACDYLYTTPSHQSPTMVTMSLERRKALLRRALAADFVVIEDDYESETNFVGEPTPAIKSFDTSSRVIYVGSLSRTLAPGLRLGYLVGPAELIRELRVLRRLMVRHPPANNQRSVALFLARGHYDSLLRRLNHVSHDRWQAMGDALDRYLPELRRPQTSGGTCYWVEGPKELDAAELQRIAATRGILIETGGICFTGKSPPQNYFRLGFSSIDTERIAPGIERLAKVIHEMVRRW